jgi:hypothetical protein
MTQLEDRPAPSADRRLHRGRVALLAVLGGFLLSVAWSATFVDEVIGDSVANGLLGHDAKETAINGAGAGVVFAFVSGFAGTFTACNIAVFGGVAPILGGSGGRWDRVRAALTPLLWLFAGMVAVSAVYGIVVGMVGTGMPQFDTAANTPGTLSPRSIQSMVVFGLVGLSMTYLGLATLGYLRDPFANSPRARLVFFGMLVGAFLIGRPFPLFRKLFRDAAERRDPLYGAGAFVLQSIGNILVLAVLMLVVAWFAGGRLRRWLATNPARLTALSAAALLVAGVFTVLYWDVRLLAMREIIPWYPIAPWS